MLPDEGAAQLRTAARVKAWCFICFALGYLVLNYPVLQIFNHPLTVMGLPLMVAYLLGIWLFGIAVLFFLTRLLLKYSEKT